MGFGQIVVLQQGDLFLLVATLAITVVLTICAWRLGWQMWGPVVSPEVGHTDSSTGTDN